MMEKNGKVISFTNKTYRRVYTKSLRKILIVPSHSIIRVFTYARVRFGKFETIIVELSFKINRSSEQKRQLGADA